MTSTSSLPPDLLVEDAEAENRILAPSLPQTVKALGVSRDLTKAGPACWSRAIRTRRRPAVSLDCFREAAGSRRFWGTTLLPRTRRRIRRLVAALGMAK